jgi:hypothetical protein
MATISIQTSTGCRDIEVRWRGAFLAVHSPNGNEPVRGLWSITFMPAGMKAASVATNLKAAIALAKAWDSRFASLDPKDAKAWPDREEWAQAIRETETPAIAQRLAREKTKAWLDKEFTPGAAAYLRKVGL